MHPSNGVFLDHVSADRRTKRHRPLRFAIDLECVDLRRREVPQRQSLARRLDETVCIRSRVGDL